MDGDELIAAFENGKTGTESFSHADHVRMAFEYLRRYETTEVLERFPAALKRFAAARGKAGLYHETITWAFVLLIQERLAGAKSGVSWEEFANANADLVRGGKKYLEKYYRAETIGSDFAKKTFVFPDKIGE